MQTTNATAKTMPENGEQPKSVKRANKFKIEFGPKRKANLIKRTNVGRVAKDRGLKAMAKTKQPGCRRQRANM